MNVVACKTVWFLVERSTSTHRFSSLPMAKMFKTWSSEAVVQSHLSQRRHTLRRQIHAHGLLRKTGRPQHSIIRIKNRDLVGKLHIISFLVCTNVQADSLLPHLNYRNSDLADIDSRHLQESVACRALVFAEHKSRAKLRPALP